MFRQVLLSACVLACAAVGLATAQVPIALPPAKVDSARFVGPFKVGMTLTEARAAGPALAWRDEHSERSNKVVGITADNALTIGAFRFDIAMRPGYYGAYEMQLTSAMPAKNRAACRKNAIALVGELEQRHGAFSAAHTSLPPQRMSAPRTQVMRTSEGVPIVTMAPGYLVGPARKELKAGARSAIETIDGHFQNSDMSWGAQQTADPRQPIQVEGRFEKDGGKNICSATITLSRDGDPPPRQTVEGSTLTLVKSPSAEVLHFSLDDVKLPAGGVTATATCRVDRQSGRVLGPCENISPIGMASAVRDRAREMAFAESEVDPDNPAPLYATMTFKLSPADRMKNPPKKELPVIYAPAPRNNVSMLARRPTTEELYQYYPPAALRREIEATVYVRCTVNADFSLACAEGSVQSAHQMDAALEEEFKRAGLAISKLVRVTPTGRDGKTTVGGSVVLPVAFRLPN